DDERRSNSDVRQQNEPHPDDERRARTGTAAARDAATCRRPWAPGSSDTGFVYDSCNRQVSAKDNAYRRSRLLVVALETIGSLNAIGRPLRRIVTLASDPTRASATSRKNCDGSSTF